MNQLIAKRVRFIGQQEKKMRFISKEKINKVEHKRDCLTDGTLEFRGGNPLMYE